MDLEVDANEARTPRRQEETREENSARERLAVPNRDNRPCWANPPSLRDHVVGRSLGARNVGMSVKLAVDLCFRSISRRVRNDRQK